MNLVDAAEVGVARTPAAATAWTRLGWRRFLGRLRAVADWRLLAFATALFAAVVVMSGLLFVIIRGSSWRRVSSSTATSRGRAGPASPTR